MKKTARIVRNRDGFRGMCSIKVIFRTISKHQGCESIFAVLLENALLYSLFLLPKKIQLYEEVFLCKKSSKKL